jgi:hypothetical protein
MEAAYAATVGFPLMISGGQKTAHCPEHALLPLRSFSNR